MKAGFTIIELLIAIGILGLLLVMGGLSYNSLRQRVALDNTADEVVNALRTVQGWAITGQDGTDMQCISFTSTGYTAPANPPCSSDCKINYSLMGINLSPTLTPICFKRLSGEPAPLPPATTLPPYEVQITSQSSRTVHIEANGNIYKN